MTDLKSTKTDLLLEAIQNARNLRLREDWPGGGGSITEKPEFLGPRRGWGFSRLFLRQVLKGKLKQLQRRRLMHLEELGHLRDLCKQSCGPFVPPGGLSVIAQEGFMHYWVVCTPAISFAKQLLFHRLGEGRKAARGSGRRQEGTADVKGLCLWRTLGRENSLVGVGLWHQRVERGGPNLLSPSSRGGGRGGALKHWFEEVLDARKPLEGGQVKKAVPNIYFKSEAEVRGEGYNLVHTEPK